MLRGLESVKEGIKSVLEMNDNVANNLANVNTTGFKRTQLVFKDIHESEIKKADQTGDGYEQKNNKIGSLSLGSCVDAAIIDFTQGGIKQTGNPLDLAINGDGFFEVELPDGSNAYTRNGNFKLQQDGTLTNYENMPVLGEGGPIKIELNNKEIGEIVISEDGAISYGQKTIGKISVVDFEDKINMKSLGASLFVPTDPKNNKPEEIKDTTLIQGSLESSNSNVIESLVNSITASRTYESMNSVIKTNSKILEKTISQVGKVRA